MSSNGPAVEARAELFGTCILEGNIFKPANRERGCAREKGLTGTCRLILVEARNPLHVGEGCEELRRRFPEMVERQKDLRASGETTADEPLSASSRGSPPSTETSTNLRSRQGWGE